LRRSRTRSLNFGTGRGGRTGDEPPSAVEVVERAGEPGASRDVECFSVMPSCANATGGGLTAGEDSPSMIAV
jgi:hypothetical protein